MHDSCNPCFYSMEGLGGFLCSMFKRGFQTNLTWSLSFRNCDYFGSLWTFSFGVYSLLALLFRHYWMRIKIFWGNSKVGPLTQILHKTKMSVGAKLHLLPQATTWHYSNSVMPHMVLLQCRESGHRCCKWTLFLSLTCHVEGTTIKVYGKFKKTLWMHCMDYL